MLISQLFTRGRTSTGTRMSMKKRSPSPVVTGKVSSFRSAKQSSERDCLVLNVGYPAVHLRKVRILRYTFKQIIPEYLYTIINPHTGNQKM